ncbi:MAG: ABC transporter ATP-binding protein [Clostridia bacterium]|nr:ABC transporter ATP-binding protein [Clostridia bacterium]
MKKETRTKTKGKLKLVRRFLSGSARWFLLSAFLALFTSFAEMLTPQIVRFTVDGVIGGETEGLSSAALAVADRFGGVAAVRERFWLIPLAILAAALLAVGSRYLFRLSNSLGAETLVKRMRDTLFSHIEHLPFSFHRKNQTGDIIQRCTSDVDTVKNFLAEQLTQVFRIVTLLVLSLSFMFSMNAKLSVIALCSVPILFFYSLLFHRKISASFRECDETEGKLSAITQENLTGVRVVRAFGRESFEQKRFAEQNEKYASLWVRLSAVFSFYWGSTDLIAGIQVMLIVLFGAKFVLSGEMLSGEYIAFISYNAMLTWPVRMLGRMIANLSKATVALDRIAYIANTPEERDEPDAGTPDLRGDIVFDHVSFGYEGKDELLSDLSLTIPAGSTLGILGGTGSGKSTIAALLDRLYPLEEGKGRITIGGTDIKKIQSKWLRQNIGFVLQEPFLFSRSLKENIGITRRDPTEEEIRRAASIACFEETADSFADGFDTFVGERGVTLSGGQKQRAAIARTLMSETPILIFDDSTSALDAETDAKIRAALREKLRGTTVILITHRVQTVMHADRIIVLDRGRIAEEGTHETLSAGNGVYAELCRLQGEKGGAE